MVCVFWVKGESETLARDVCLHNSQDGQGLETVRLKAWKDVRRRTRNVIQLRYTNDKRLLVEAQSESFLMEMSAASLGLAKLRIAND